MYYIDHTLQVTANSTLNTANLGLSGLFKEAGGKGSDKPMVLT